MINEKIIEEIETYARYPEFLTHSQFKNFCKDMLLTGDMEDEKELDKIIDEKSPFLG